MMIDMAGVEKLIQETSDCVFQAMIERSLGVSGPCELHIACGR